MLLYGDAYDATVYRAQGIHKNVIHKTVVVTDINYMLRN